ncbi:uncharacterized protein PFL1_05071 [Pseudozyma flocculosa PF-1]|uniref:C3H1-type domain-containing protein n=2 Tax=Pseudozyma flocculosa TaxID=84751 RepID=A0A5C3EVF1_9BASI|nr:uncharacterized protein PFL1_05071 [Pseudozyma flocculosa PF-1]EPQ27533.1 hypothetical protein PFL1_05071 [Pseudozyma flocculosa PF-1]SPO36032.1 uncharacterized protein PSFLO_01503 [Pseudozyma flocculosa]
MSAAVKAALAARRAANRSRSTSPSKPAQSSDQEPNHLGSPANQLDSAFISPFGSPKPRGRALGTSTANSGADAASADAGDVIQKPIEDIVRSSVDNGRANLASRSPALTEVPHLLLTLLSDEPPTWFQQIPDDERGPWYAREELRTLQLANNDIQHVSPRISEFPLLSRLELQNNRIASIPDSFFHLTALTTVSLANNGLTAVPTCLLAIDTLVTLNLARNKISKLWDDASVLHARGEREQWDRDQARADDSVWSGLSGGNKGKAVKPLAGAREAPMHGLKSLDLSKNKLDNAALGIPDLSRRKHAAASAGGAASSPVRLPPSLKKLDLGHNALRGPISILAFAGLSQLEDLSLRGSGIGDDVFLAQNDESAAATQAFTALTTLDLGGCELDDLNRLEELFSSKPTKPAESALIADTVVQPGDREAEEDLRVASTGVAAHQLVRVANRQSPSDLDRMVKNNDGAVLCLLLDGNPLREEALKQKRGIRASASPVKRANPSAPPNDATAALQAQDPAIAAVSRTSSPAMPSMPGTPSRGVADGADAGTSAEPDAGPGAGGENILHQFLRGRSTPRRVPDGINKTGLSDWDGEASPVRPSRGSKDRGTSQQRSNSDEAADKDPGSALATAKLSTKKKEALGQVPCKFFRSNGCSAGSSCPFAHTLPGDGQQKATCQWFLKGSCRFGHKCALAHVLPGQPMSMDRKNKRAAQHGQPLPQAPTQTVQPTSASSGSQQASNRAQQNGLAQHPIPSQLQTSRQQMSDPQQPHSQFSQQQPTSSPSYLQQQHHTPQPPGQRQSYQQQPTMLSDAARQQVHSFSGRDHELPFGLPDDLQAVSPPPNSATRSLLDTLNGPTAERSKEALVTPQHRANLLSELNNAGSLSSSQRPLAVPGTTASSSFGAAHPGHGGLSLGSPPAARAFGTSPFSHPGGHGLFFSGSQDSEGGAGPFARTGRDAMFGARSMGRIDDAGTKAKWWSSLGGAGPKEEEDDDVDNDGTGAEDFLPSSLSDLLTPAELERRRRNSQMSTSLGAGAREGRVMPQSLPAQAGVVLGSSFNEAGLGYGRRAIGAERGPRDPARTGNISTGFLQRSQGDVDDVHGPRPPGERRFSSGLDGIALNEGAVASSPGRAALHAPGQSLPQGLAAGLSRLHLAAGRTPDQGNLGVGSGSNIGHLSANAAGSASQHAQPGNPRNLGAHLNGDYELGPTAPSSVLPHRSPLGMAIGSGSGRLSGAFGSPGTIGSGAHFSPSSFGAQRRTFGGEPASMESDSAKHQHAVGAGSGVSVAIGTGAGPGRPHQHPGMQRLRPSSSSITPHSPLTLPEFTHEEVEEEAIFELE